ncbi:DUF2913 family protein [Vibrio rarus]|uniref:DUF2913 family protein n=1 Tax=Vibrio rarus TaxID=413403 RepID=UPI0021C38736|nr:DUF2913 family protein [Vibrio rarus]
MSYAVQIEAMTCHSLLHLEMQKPDTKGFLSTEKRNQILVKYLKGIVKSPKYKLIKKEIKTLILLGRKKGQDLESRIVALLVLEKPKGNNDLEHFYFLIKDIERQLSTSVQYSPNFKLEKQETKQSVEILIHHADLHNCFDDKMTLTDTLDWLVRASATKEAKLLNIIGTYKMFAVEHERKEELLRIKLKKA